MIILSTGRADSGMKATLALHIGLGALALGEDVYLYLAMDGACWAFEECSAGVKVPNDEPVSAYMTQFQELGGRVLVCSRCAEGLCGEQCPSERTMIGSIQYAGTASIAELAGESTVHTF